MSESTPDTPPAFARPKSKQGLVTADVVGKPYGLIGGAADTRNADYTYAAGDVIAYIAQVGTTDPAGFETLTAATWHCLGWLDTNGGIFNLSQTTKDIGAAGSRSAIRTVITGGTKTLQFTALEPLNPYTRALYDDVPVATLKPNSRVDAGSGTTSASNVVTDTNAVSNDVGSSVTGTGIPVGAVITSVTSGTSFVMSTNATATSTNIAVTVNSNVSAYVLPEVPNDNRYAVLLDTVDGAKAMRLFSPNGKITARGNDQVQQADAEMLQMTFTFYPATIDGIRGELKRYIQYPPGEVPADFSLTS
jgi:glycine/D-amino acid oxidase-like deaminating enzyme